MPKRESESIEFLVKPCGCIHVKPIGNDDISPFAMQVMTKWLADRLIEVAQEKGVPLPELEAISIGLQWAIDEERLPHETHRATN